MSILDDELQYWYNASLSQWTIINVAVMEYFVNLSRELFLSFTFSITPNRVEKNNLKP